MQSNRQRALQFAYAGLVCLVLALTWIARSPLHQMPLERDEGAYALIATRWLAGDVPYRDLFDHKPPFVYLVYALAHLLPGDAVSSIRVLATLYLLAGALALLALGLRLFDRWTALAAMTIFLAYGSSLRFQGITFNTEAIMLLPAILAGLFFVRAIQDRRHVPLVLSGFCVGLAILAKPVGGLLVPALGLALLAMPLPWRYRFVGSGLLLVGLLLAALPFGIYFWSQEALGAARAALVDYNRLYLQETAAHIDWRRLWRIWQTMLVLAVPALLGLLCIFTRRAWRTPAHVALVLWGLALLATTVLSLRPYQHYYLAALPACALWSATLIATLARLVSRPPRRGSSATVSTQGMLVRGGVSLALLVGLIAPAAREVWSMRALSPDEQVIALYGDDGLNFFAQSAEVSHYLAERTAPDDPIFVWASEPQIYYLAQRQPATRFIYDYPLAALPAARAEALALLERRLPPFIITYYCVRPLDSDRFFRDNGYRLLANIGGFDIFAREGEEAPRGC